MLGVIPPLPAGTKGNERRTSMGFTKEQAYKARNADLASFLLQLDPVHYRRIGCSVRLIDPSRPKGRNVKGGFSAKSGASWWHDFSTGETKNAVNYLTERLNYSLEDAIKALSGETIEYHPADIRGYTQPPVSSMVAVPPIFPEPTAQKPRQMYAYLMHRGLSAGTIRQLEELGILYQSKEHNNLVFVNRERDFAEIRGTCSFGAPFHSVIKNQPDRFWYFCVGRPEKVYVCESSIDAVSLYELRRKEGTIDNAVYASIAGVANQRTIDRIRTGKMEVILAVDNDAAGQACRDRNPDLKATIPIHKDWNEDLQKGKYLSINEVIHKAESRIPVQNQKEENCTTIAMAR